jgi:uncharacterized protein
MKLEDDFALDAPLDRVWEVLNDVELIAPCMPGFSLTEADGERFRGTMKVKLGALTVQYDADVTIVERDEAAHAVRMAIAGREHRGGGSVRATVTSRLAASGTGTRVALSTDLQLTGRVAQMGRGMIGDVSSAMVGDFVRALERDVLAGPAPSNGDASAPPMPPRAPAEPVDLTAVAGRSALKALGPVLLGVLALALLAWRRRR